MWGGMVVRQCGWLRSWLCRGSIAAQPLHTLTPLMVLRLRADDEGTQQSTGDGGWTSVNGRFAGRKLSVPYE